MSALVQLTMIDWPLYQRLRSAYATITEKKALTEALANESYHAEDVAEDDEAQWRKLDFELAGPRALRRKPATGAGPLAKWLLDQTDAEVADDVLMACSFADGPLDLGIEDYLILSWFSPAYRLAALGVPGTRRAGVLPYDGPQELLQAMASPLSDDDDQHAVFEPLEALPIFRGLARLVVDDGGRGEMGMLLDFMEDHAIRAADLASDVESGVELLQTTYGEAASRTFGVLVTNG